MLSLDEVKMQGINHPGKACSCLTEKKRKTFFMQRKPKTYMSQKSRSLRSPFIFLFHDVKWMCKSGSNVVSNFVDAVRMCKWFVHLICLIYPRLIILTLILHVADTSTSALRQCQIVNCCDRSAAPNCTINGSLLHLAPNCPFCWESRHNNKNILILVDFNI